MGWMRLRKTTPGHATRPSQHQVKDQLAPLSAHIEIAPPQQAATNATETVRKYPFQPESRSDDDLPFISQQEVTKKQLTTTVPTTDQFAKVQQIWIVVDDIVYDCSKFIFDHPGGVQVIWSFSGQDCSWQFWRFHDKALKEQFGRPLRIGRTSGVLNKFEEQPRYVGMLNRGDDDWYQS